jgi:hypothetical protein
VFLKDNTIPEMQGKKHLSSTKLKPTIVSEKNEAKTRKKKYCIW